MQKNKMSDSLRGFILAFGAYGLWGFMPLYFKFVGHIPPMEVVAHRIIWAIPMALILLLLLGEFVELKKVLRQPRMLAMAVLTAGLISINWSVYVWAVAHDMVLEAALGYYINPLFNVALGAVFLSEKLTKLQWVAIGFATVAVIVLTINAGGLPWVSLVLPLSFAFYGFFRKSLPLAPLPGFTLEVLLLSVPAMVLVGWYIMGGEDHFVAGSAEDIFLLILAGPVSATPLILFSYGAKLLRYTTLGLMQYIAPTTLFLLAIFAFGEPFSKVQFFAFTLIWIGLALYTWSSLRQFRRK